MENILKGRKALITGASRGIGKAVVELFASEGAEIFCCARSEEKLQELRDRLRQTGCRIWTKIIDLQHSSEIERLFQSISEHTDRLDIVVNAAGVFAKSKIETMDENDYENIMSVNLKAPLLIGQKAIPFLSRSGNGAIVNVSSLSGCFSYAKFEGFGAYDISKYGLWGLTEILAVELKDRNIRVNQISPSGVDTEMFYNAFSSDVKPSLSPEEVARKILYLASDQSAPMTGENVIMLGEDQ